PKSTGKIDAANGLARATRRSSAFFPNEKQKPIARYVPITALRSTSAIPLAKEANSSTTRNIKNIAGARWRRDIDRLFSRKVKKSHQLVLKAYFRKAGKVLKEQ